MSTNETTSVAVGLTELTPVQSVSNLVTILDQGSGCSENVLIPISKDQEWISSGSIKDLVLASIPSEPLLNPTVILDSSLSIERAADATLDSLTQKRKKVADSGSWARNIKKDLKMKGKRFDSNKENVVEARSFGERPVCETHTKVYKCSEVCEDLRHRIFTSFWNDLNWGHRKVYIRSLCEKTTALRIKSSEPIRLNSFRYYLNLDGNNRVRVCKHLFLATFGIGKKMVRNWCKSDQFRPALYHRANPKINTTQAFKLAEEFLEKLPKQESHYCRQSSSKLYLEPIFTTFSQLFSVYKEKCKSDKQQALSITRFKVVFEKLNLSLAAPKQDLCNICQLFESNEVTQEEYEKHVSNKNRARAENVSDKQACLEQKSHVLTVDMQGVKQAPVFNANCVYFKSKLNVYNYTIFHLGTRNVKCYFWNESQGGLPASVFASNLIDYLEGIRGKKPVIIFSDGCGYQNRNVVLSNAILNYSMKSGVTVVQKYLEKGHTQMECDSVHSLLERKCRNVKICLPSDYLSICIQARKQPYEAKEISYETFNDYSNKAFERYTSIRPGYKKGDPEVKDIRALKYDPSGIIFYKIDFDSDWAKLPQEPRKLKVCDRFYQLYKSPLKLNQRKWEELQVLKNYLPNDSRAFYENLPH